jgi:UDP-N-acetylmuramoylalanine--D-glutamate ligase
MTQPTATNRHPPKAPMALSGRSALVVGLGRSGVSAACFLVEKGATVTVTDRAPEAALGDAPQTLRQMGVNTQLGAHRPEAFLAADLIVISPGVPHTLSPLSQAAKRGVEVIGEIELASRFIQTPMVAITGTNGKSTVTTLIADMLTASGKTVFVGGNLGTPLIDYVRCGPPADIAVVEISSFQLDTAVSFHPQVAVVLNVTPDHLDRYPDMAAYARCKQRLLKHLRAQDTAVLNGADVLVRAMAAGTPAQVQFFTGCQSQEAGARVSDLSLNLFPRQGPLEIDLSGFRLCGRFNRENAAAAGLAALAAGASRGGIQQAIDQYRGLSHRMQLVATIGGVRYIDDSKATNIDAVLQAVDSLSQPLVLIMGGRFKGGDLTALAACLAQNVKALVLIGEAAGLLQSALGTQVPTVMAATMTEAVSLAAGVAKPGDTVLLSPACSSFDMYRSYAQRGEQFCRAVNQLHIEAS